jgi:hypothetical protein
LRTTGFATHAAVLKPASRSCVANVERFAGSTWAFEITPERCGSNPVRMAATPGDVSVPTEVASEN